MGILSFLIHIKFVFDHILALPSRNYVSKLQYSITSTYIFEVNGDEVHVTCVLAVHTVLLVHEVIP